MANSYTKTSDANGQHVVSYYDENGTKTETRVGGEASWRYNNPGNIRWLSGGKSSYFKDKLGAIGTNGKFAIFPSWDVGNEAKHSLFKIDPNYKGASIEGAMEAYAPSSENNTKAYLEFIRKRTGLDTSRKVDSLTPEEYQKWVDAITAYESHGQIKGKGTTILPEDDDKHPEVSAHPKQLTPEERAAPPTFKQKSELDQGEPAQQTADSTDVPPSDNLPNYAQDITGDSSPVMFGSMAQALTEMQPPAADTDQTQTSVAAEETRPDTSTLNVDAPPAPAPPPANDNLPTYAADITGDNSPTLFAPMSVALNEAQGSFAVPQSQDDSSTGISNIA